MKRTLFTVAVASLLLSGRLAAQDNPFLGTWKMNAAKSKYSSGPAPQSQITTIAAQGNGIEVSTEGTAADGSHIAWSFTANYTARTARFLGGRVH